MYQLTADNKILVSAELELKKLRKRGQRFEAASVEIQISFRVNISNI